jgi:hypothetical protein
MNVLSGIILSSAAKLFYHGQCEWESIILTSGEQMPVSGEN